MANEQDSTRTQHCDNCGGVYWEPADEPLDPDYMFEGHVLFECEEPRRTNSTSSEVIFKFIVALIAFLGMVAVSSHLILYAVEVVG